MKSFTVKIVLSLFILILIASPARPQIVKTAQAGMTFLNIGVGARAEGMGGSFICRDNDISAIFWNPAGIASIKGGAFTLERNMWFADITQNSAAVAYGFGKYGVLGLNVIAMDYGTFYGTEIGLASDLFFDYVETGEFTIDEYAVGLSYARMISDKFSVGGQVKYVYQDLFSSTIQKGLEDPKQVDNIVDVFAVDFGTHYKTGFHSLTFAMVARNFSKNIQFPEQTEDFSLPLIFTIGVSMDVLDLAPSVKENHSLLVSFDGIHPRDYEEKGTLGLEYGFMNAMFLRFGYKWNFSAENFAMGAGFKFKMNDDISLNVNYAYSNMRYFDAVHRFSLSGSF